MGCRRRCCCPDAAECQYFNDDFDQGPVGGSPSSDWVQCGGTWTLEEDTFEPPIPGQTVEVHEAGTNGAILMCQERHPEGNSTMLAQADLRQDVVGVNQGIIFDATLNESGCPTDYSYVTVLYEPFFLAPFDYGGYLRIGTKNGGLIQEVAFRFDPGDSITGNDLLNVRIDPIKNGRSQVQAYYGTGPKGNFTMTCLELRGGQYAGLINVSTEVAKFRAFRLFETCHTNTICSGNPCTIEKYCVPRALKLTISNVTCEKVSGPGSCPDLGGDEGREFDLDFQAFGIDSIPHVPFDHKEFEYIWTAFIGFGCFADQETYPEVAELFCGHDAFFTCPDDYDDCTSYGFGQHYDAESSNHPLPEGVLSSTLTSCTNNPIVIEFTGVVFLHRGPDPPGGGPLCKVTLDALITER